MSEQPHAQQRWEPSPYVLLRLAGKPYTELERLKFTSTVPLLRQIIALRREVEAQRAAVSDALFQHIGAAEGEQRGQLVALRRDLHNGRRSSRQRRALLKPLGDRELRRNVALLLRRSAHAERLLRQARQVFERELAEKRALLQESLRDPELQKGLQVASPAVFEGVSSYVKADPAALRTRARKAEVGLYKYLMRMAGKTSPFSRFGPIALGRYNPEAEQAVTLRETAPAVRGTSELQLSLVSAIADVVGRDAAVQPHLRPELNSAAYERESQLVLMRPYTPIVRPGAGGSAMRRGPYAKPVRDFVEFWRGLGHERPSLQQLVERYAAAIGAPVPTAQAFIQRLIDSGLLINDLGMPSDAPDRLTALAAVLRALDLPATNAAAEQVEQLHALVSSFSHADVGTRQQIIRSVQDQLAALFGELPLAQRVRNDLQHTLVEDVALTGVELELGPAFFRPFLAEMAALLDCVDARDQGSLGYATLRDTFVDAYGPGGRCANPLQFIIEELGPTIFKAEQEALSANQLIPTDNGRPRVNAANRRLLQYLELLNRLSASARGQHEAQIPRAALEELTERFGGPRRNPQSAAFHFQIAAESREALDRGDFLIVLNYTLSGFGRFFMRYWRLFDSEQGETLLRQIRQRQAALAATLPDGAGLVEILSVLENNAQVHPPLVERQLVLPHERSALPLERQLQPADVALVHDEASDEVVLYAQDQRTGELGQRLLPLYMGFFHAGSVLLHHRAFLDLSPSSYIPSGLRPNEFVSTHDSSPERPITHYPRLSIGRLVLQRELWAVPAAAAPRPEGDELEQFIAYLGWVEAHGLPSAFFMRTKHAYTDLASISDVASLNKPLLIDSENFFAWRMLAQTIQGETLHTLLIEEMLPAPSQLPFTVQGQPYVVELQIEFTRGANA